MRIFLTLILLAVAHGLHAQAASDDWSASMLENLLGAPSVSSARTANSGQPSTLPQEGMVVRVYQIRNQQVGAPEMDTKLAVLEKILPAGSRLLKDAPANSVSILTNPTMQEAVRTYLSAIDSPPASATKEIPAEVQQALKQMASASQESARVIQNMGAIKEDIAAQLSKMSEQNKRHLYWFAFGGVVLAVGIVIFLWATRKRDNKSYEQLALVPTAEFQKELSNSSIERDAVIQLLNHVAKRMETDREDQLKLAEKMVAGQLMLAEMKVQVGELGKERDLVLRETKAILQDAAKTFTENTEVLQTEQSRVQALADELRATLSELDAARDKLKDETIETTKIRFELERERAKVAALSIMLEEGSLPIGESVQMPSPVVVDSKAAEAETAEMGQNPTSQISSGSDGSKTTIAQDNSGSQRGGTKRGWTFHPPDPNSPERSPN